MARMGGTTWDDIPDETCESIFNQCVHSESVFSSQIEYGVLVMRRQPYPLDVSQFAAGIVGVCKRFHRIGIGILWKYVVIRSAASLTLVTQLSPKYGQHTLRMDLRLEGEYDRSLVRDAMSHMPKLVVFLNRNFTKYINSNPHSDPGEIIEALSQHRPSLRRVQLDSEWEYPSVLQVRDLLNANPQLEALRLCGIAPTSPAAVKQSLAITPLTVKQSMRSISLGATYWIWQTEHRERALSSFVNMLTTSGAFPKLETAHIFENTTATLPFFQRYGHQLFALLYVPPDRNSMHSWEANCPHFADLCPNITRVSWFIKNWNSVDHSRPLPGSHKEIQVADIIVHKLEPEVLPEYEATIRVVLEHLVSADFPRLNSVTLLPRGGQIPPFQEAPWFLDMVRLLKREGESSTGLQHPSAKIQLHVI